jgi:hypothetical protein
MDGERARRNPTSPDLSLPGDDWEASAGMVVEQPDVQKGKRGQPNKRALEDDDDETYSPHPVKKRKVAKR